MVVAALSGCSDDNAGGVDPKDCDAVLKRLNTLSLAAGCDGNESSSCEDVYARKECVTEWEAAINCISPKTASDFACDDTSGRIDPKPGVCTTEIAALSKCFGE